MRVIYGIAVLSILFTTNLLAQSDDEIAKEIIAITKAQWAAQIDKNYEKSNATIAEEYTEFSSDFPVRLDGKALNNRMIEGYDKAGGGTLVADMANEKVQVYGDVAILTYNYIGLSQDKDGKVEPNLAKSTRVYAKKKGGWMLVHANFAPVTNPD